MSQFEQEAVARQLEIDALRQQLRERERDIEQMKQAGAAAQAELEELRGSIGRLQQEMAELRQATEPNAIFSKMAKEVAFQASGRNEVFGKLLDDLQLNDYLPIRLKDELEVVLSMSLGVDPGSQDLTDLIKIAKLRSSFDQEEIDLLYAVRNQRNASAHPRKSKRTLQARALLSLYAAAIIWPKVST